jgi:hypothetical protein
MTMTTMFIDDAPCIGLAATFFPEEENDETVRPAKEICFTCPDKLVCLDGSLYEEWGVWGGMSSWERRPYRHKLSKAFTNILPEIVSAIDAVSVTLNRSMDCILW